MAETKPAAKRKGHGRTRRSRIQQLPEDIRASLDALLREGRMSQAEILEQVNDLCRQHGEEPLSQSSLSRYQKRMDDVGRKIRESREVAEVWVAKLGSAPTSDIGKLVQEIVRTLAFDLVMSASESEKPIEPKALNQLALALTRIEQAAMASHKREQEIRQLFAEEAAAKAEEVMVNQGMTAGTIASIKKEILGIA
ncbi:DUF3486 family protein [Kistimonas scapharcae]|uniref:DUF3486 family protein n=1 Tax=Kistimonas scapharcae TaxID=1036133 RepID=A0ABP8V6G4_9GAMM